MIHHRIIVFLEIVSLRQAQGKLSSNDKKTPTAGEWK